VAVAVVAAVLALQHVWVARHGPAAALRAFDANLVIGLVVLVGVVADHAARGAGG
jgi:4-hydroxybenzoate polyprenyltransferase